MIRDNHILYLDDEMDNLLVFQKLFQKEYDVSICQTAEEAYQILDSQDIQLIIADQRMPKVTGVEFLSAAFTRYPKALRILMTGYTDIQSAMDAINYGKIYQFVSKPWNKAELEVILHSAFEYYNLQHKNDLLIKELSDTIRELDAFLYSSSHSLKSPLVTQLSLLELMKQDGTAPVQQYLNSLEQTTGLLERTISKLQEASNISVLSIEGGQEIDFLKTINAIESEMSESFQSKNISFYKNINVNRGFRLSESLIKLILENTIENSVHFMKPVSSYSGEIHVNVFQSENNITLKVKDNGMGIDENYISKVFEPFYRNSDQSIGSGLGLYIVKKIVSSLNGTVQLESERGVGTEITMELPSAYT